jgi:hypothetical protein
MKKLISITLTVLMVLLSNCSLDKTTGPVEAGDPPELPPASSMTIPSFNGQDGLAKQHKAESNFAVLFSSVAVGYWTLTVQLALVQPVVLFALAHSTQPEPLPDNSGWVWTIGNLKYQARLVGKVEQDSVRWSMIVTGGNLVDYKWFDGTATITGKSGYWTFYDTAAVNGEYPGFYRFEYEIGDPIEQVKASVVKQDDPDYGCFLKWAADGDDRSFEAYDAKKPETVLISWDAVTEAGSVENLTTGEKYCWDTKENGQVDIPCAE